MKDKMKDISLVIARTLLKVTSNDEKKELLKWKQVSKENESFVHNLKLFWDQPLVKEPNEGLLKNRNRLLYRIENSSKQKIGNRSLYYFTRIAAVLVLCLVFAGLGIYIASISGFYDSKNVVEVSTEAGQQSKVTLPDGSFVWLNANTSVEYSNLKNVRKVNLIGEAYFEVKHDTKHPFVVEVNNVKIKVLGTKFNVTNYADSKTTIASLLSGKIAMSFSDEKEIELHPGQKIVYDREQNKYSKKMVDVQKDIIWRKGILVFENELFEDMLHKLERYYAVEFVFDKGIVKNIHYSGTIDNLSINKVLEFINLTIPMNYEINNKVIHIEILENGN